MSEARLTSLTIESPAPARTIAVRARESKSEAAGPGLFWLGGFKSDMKGTKAEALDRWAEQAGRGCVRFDYSGHGESGGDFKDGTIGRWLEETVAVYAQFVQGPQVVIGSSMGGWLALLLAQALRKRRGAAPIAGMVLIAPAVDFTEELMWKNFSPATRREIEENGAWMRPSEYSEGPYPITKGLIEDGRRHLLLGGLIETGCPVHILQGVQDLGVPPRHVEVLHALQNMHGAASLDQAAKQKMPAAVGIFGRALSDYQGTDRGRPHPRAVLLDLAPGCRREIFPHQFLGEVHRWRDQHHAGDGRGASAFA